MNKHTSALIMTSLPLSGHQDAKLDPLTLPLQERSQSPSNNYVMNEPVHKSNEKTIVEPHRTLLSASHQSQLEELSSPYEHLITKTSTDFHHQHSDHHPYETLRNDIWPEIYPISKQHATSQRQATSTCSHQNDLKKILNPLGLELESLHNEAGDLFLEDNKMEVDAKYETLLDHKRSLLDNVATPSAKNSAVSQSHIPYGEFNSDMGEDKFPVITDYTASLQQVKPVLGISSQKGGALIQEAIQSCTDYESNRSLSHSTDHVYKSLSQNELNFKNSEIVHSTHDEFIFKETTALTMGEKYDSTNDYECIRAGNGKIYPPSKETDTDGSASRPLPVVPLDIYESLNTSKDKLNVHKLFLQRMCFWIRKMSLVLAILVGFVIAAVFATLFILQMSGDGDNIGAGYNYTKSPTGCMCYFNMTRKDCACCQNGGCQCPADYPHQCVKCNHEDSCGKAEISDIDKRPTGTKTLLFLDNTTLIHVIPMKIFVWGITLLGHQLFAIIGDYGSSIVNVYDSQNFTFSHRIPIIGSSDLRAIVASPTHNCLFIGDMTLRVIHRYDLLSNKVITKWSLDGECWGISLTRTGNVVATLLNLRRIDEFTPDGTLVHKIWLESTIDDPQHAVKLSNGQYVVSHGRIGSKHRVCAVNYEGRIIRCYGGARGSEYGLLNEPRYLALDSRENVLVAEKLNDRVLVLNATLDYVGDITMPGLTQPWAIHLDELNHRLYIGEETLSGRLFVVTV